jgi:GT2 family glycosyltransferase
MRKVSIILLWWSRTPELETMSQECLSSILKNTAYPEYEVIIVENKSIHPSKFLREFQPKTPEEERVKISIQDENLGFVKGNNLGIELAGANDVLMINNDILVPAGWLTPIVKIADDFDDCAMAMPTQIHKGSKEYLDLGCDIDKVLSLATDRIAKNKDVNKASKMQQGNWLPLCATLVTRKAIDKVGLLDENFKLGGFEDTDYSWRCLDAGFNLYVTSGSFIWHYYGQSFHYHQGYAEVWVETGKYLMQKHSAEQDSHGNVFRWKDKPEGWTPQ